MLRLLKSELGDDGRLTGKVSIRGTVFAVYGGERGYGWVREKQLERNRVVGCQSGVPVLIKHWHKR